MTQLHEYFDNDGFLVQEIPLFIAREQQLRMAQAVEKSLHDKKVSFYEAGTGTGKSFAYLVPILLSDRKVIISTGTKTLQDQLFFQDLPLLGKLFPLHQIALLKGRSNYLCSHRLNKFLSVMTSNEASLAQLVRIREWASTTVSGELSDAPPVDEDVQPLITSTRENCLASSCPDFETCALYLARKKAQEADVIIINHHLLFADLALKEDSLGSLLPEIEAIVVDEAHQVPEIARQFFGKSLSTKRLADLIRDLRCEVSLLGNDDRQLLNFASLLESENLAMVRQVLAEDIECENWLRERGQSIIKKLNNILFNLVLTLNNVSERSEGMKNITNRAEELASDFRVLTESSELLDSLRWIDKSQGSFTIHLSPIDISQTVGGLFSSTAWIFCSATLSIDGNFDHIQRALGIENAIGKVFSSPFDFHRQVKAYLPLELPKPGTDEHTHQLVESIIPILRSNLGRTFFLCTSYRALHIVRERLAGSFSILCQGDLPRRELLLTFRQTPRTVLIATHSFWQGVDMKGANLTCVVIDKLPFASPKDPLVRATMQAENQRGGNGFVDYLLPQAIIRLNQGFGRLIRSETDRGLFVLGDPRIKTHSYGELVMSSLPDMEWIELDGACKYLSEISERSSN